MISTHQGQITTVSAPVRLHGLSDELVLVRSVPEEVDVQLKSFSSLTPSPEKLDIAADIDLSGVREGQATVAIRSSDFKLPSGMVIAGFSPRVIKVVVERKVRKSVPVRVTLKGAKAHGLSGYEVVSDPARVEVEGPAGQVGRVEFVGTEEIDANRLIRGKEYRKNLIPPMKRVLILRDEPVTVRLVLRRDLR